MNTIAPLLIRFVPFPRKVKDPHDKPEWIREMTHFVHHLNEEWDSNGAPGSCGAKEQLCIYKRITEIVFPERDSYQFLIPLSQHYQDLSYDHDLYFEPSHGTRKKIEMSLESNGLCFSRFTRFTQQYPLYHIAVPYATLSFRFPFSNEYKDGVFYLESTIGMLHYPLANHLKAFMLPIPCPHGEYAYNNGFFTLPCSIFGNEDVNPFLDSYIDSSSEKNNYCLVKHSTWVEEAIIVYRGTNLLEILTFCNALLPQFKHSFLLYVKHSFSLLPTIEIAINTYMPYWDQEMRSLLFQHVRFIPETPDKEYSTKDIQFLFLLNYQYSSPFYLYFVCSAYFDVNLFSIIFSYL